MGVPCLGLQRPVPPASSTARKGTQTPSGYFPASVGARPSGSLVLLDPGNAKGSGK